ncbi:MAG: DUF3419 family protein, partial [Gemmataceae bacterium]
MSLGAVPSSLPPWVAEAATLPIAFAQVREDPWLDAAIVRRRGPQSRVLMIASGGCTLAYLAATCPIASIHVVDPNPSQLALAQLKLHLLQTVPPAERFALLGHSPLAADVRQERLRSALHSLDLAEESLGPPDVWARLGPDHAGRYERVFAEWRRAMRPYRDALVELLEMTNPVVQAARVAATTELGQAFDAAFQCVMDLPILVALFGEGATHNRVES